MPLSPLQKVRFDDLLMRGIAAVKGGQRDEARTFLLAAQRLDRYEAASWYWLSLTTDDSAERRDYLEEVVAIEPTHGAARRALLELDGRLAGAPAPPSPPAESQGVSCAACGGAMRYEVEAAALRCTRCGTLQGHGAATPVAVALLDATLPRPRAHEAATEAQRLTCAQCGATMVLPATTLTTTCPYCASNHLVTSPQVEQLLTPQAMMPVALDGAAALAALHEWLGAGRRAATLPMALRAAYYPMWWFEGQYYLRWRCEVEEQNDRWVAREGEEVHFVDGLLISGLKALPSRMVAAFGALDSRALLPYEARLLAGWPAFLYDRSLADGSIEARGLMAEGARATVAYKVDSRYRRTRNLQVIPTGVSAQNFRQILVPLWVGHYDAADGTRHEVIVHGVTGAVQGSRPASARRGLLLGALLLLLLLGGAALLVMALR